MTETEGILIGADGRRRCPWSGADPGYVAYHDEEWGFPVTDDRRLFEKLALEGFQAGLSWRTILAKRDAFRRAFHGFDLEAVAAMGERDVERLLADASIVRHRGKIEATIGNARRAIELAEECGSLAAYAWSFEPDASSRPDRMTWAALRERSVSPESKAMSKDLKRRGWRFVGPTTVYAFMQATGLVNDHVEGCFVRRAVEAARDGLDRPGSMSSRIR